MNIIHPHYAWGITKLINVLIDTFYYILKPQKSQQKNICGTRESGGPCSHEQTVEKYSNKNKQNKSRRDRILDECPRRSGLNSLQMAAFIPKHCKILK